MNFKPLKLNEFTFSLCWGRVYKIKFFGYPEEEVMFLNRLNNSRILCCSENELNEKWTERSVIAKKVTCSSAEHAYIINESAFYCGQHNYVSGAELYENFEFVDQLISLKFLDLNEIDYRYQYLWHLNDSSPEMRALYWFSNKLLSVDDIKLLEKNITTNKRIAMSMITKSGVPKYIVIVLARYMDYLGKIFINGAKDRLHIMRNVEASGLPF